MGAKCFACVSFNPHKQDDQDVESNWAPYRIIFFIAFVQLLYYYGWLQWAIGKFGAVFFWGMKVSGAAAEVAAAFSDAKDLSFLDGLGGWKGIDGTEP